LKISLSQQKVIVQHLKQLAQKALKRAGIYHRIKASHFYDLYWTFADRSIVIRSREEFRFYRRTLIGFRRGCLVFDVGANQGTKTDIFLKLGARVVAVEPDQSNQAVLKEKFQMYRLSRKPIVIVGKALSDKDAVETMWIDEPGSAKNTLSRKWVEALKDDDERFGCHHDFDRQQRVETTTLDRLIGAYGVPFFVKIDVEGFERHVLSGLHSVVPYLSFEVNLPEFRPEGQQCVDMLQRLSADGLFNYVPGRYEEGLALEDWLNAADFSRVLEQCSEKSIEVFWKTPLSSGS
jgi:FkbM family methyltransferase